tara:strand:- start:1101 stop:1253 length:153 start_codon:yes stop_codon:yes gene_type:complete
MKTMKLFLTKKNGTKFKKVFVGEDIEKAKALGWTEQEKKVVKKSTKKKGK